jgi:hypothetical protein
MYYSVCIYRNNTQNIALKIVNILKFFKINLTRIFHFVSNKLYQANFINVISKNFRFVFTISNKFYLRRLYDFLFEELFIFFFFEEIENEEFHIF